MKRQFDEEREQRLALLKEKQRLEEEALMQSQDFEVLDVDEHEDITIDPQMRKYIIGGGEDK